MTALRVHLLMGAALLAAAGCAQQPRQAAAVAPRAAAAPAPASDPAQPAGAQQSPIPGLTPQMLAAAHDEGYQSRIIQGKVFFCRREVPTGSNLPRTHCVNPTGLRWELQQQEQQRQQMQQGALMNCQPGAAGC